MSIMFETVDEILARMGDAPPFIVDGLISSEATLLYGQPKAGKGLLSLSLVRGLVKGERTWLGRTVHGGPYSVAIGVTDPGGKRETATRLRDLGVSGADLVWALDVRADTDWTGVSRFLDAHGVNVFVLDNVLGALAPGGDVRQVSDTRPVTDALTRLVDAGVAVVAIHHEGRLTADGKGGGAPMGSQQLTAWPRSTLRLSGKSALLSLKVTGNHVEPHTMRLDLTVTDHDGFWFTPLDSELQQSGSETVRRRGRSRVDHAGLAAHVVGSELRHLTSVAETARRLMVNHPEGLDLPDNVEAVKRRLERCGLEQSVSGWVLPRSA